MTTATTTMAAKYTFRIKKTLLANVERIKKGEN